MWKKLTTVLLSLVFLTGFMGISDGSRFRLVTDPQIDDFVVECFVSKDYLISHNASSYSKLHKVMVVKSNEDVSCGKIYFGGRASYIRVYHPAYTTKEIKKLKKGNYIAYMVKSVDMLDALEQQYLQKKNTNNSGTVSTYISRLALTCGFASLSDYRHKYLKAYSANRDIDYQRFKRLYYADTRACLEKQESIMHKLGRSFNYAYLGSDGKPCYKRSDNEARCKNAKYHPETAVNRIMKKLWGHATWYPYLTGSEEERNRSMGKKQTYLVVRNGEEGGGIWFLLDAYSKKQIKRKYPEFIPFEDKPKWMSESQKKRFTKDCDGNVMHWDLEGQHTGWLGDYDRGVIKSINCK